MTKPAPPEPFSAMGVASRRRVLWVALTAGMTIACAGPQETRNRHVVEGSATRDGRSADVLVKVRNVDTGRYVADAQVWHVTVVPASYGVWAPRLWEARHLMAPDGKDGYVIRLPEERRPDRRFEHFIVRVPGENDLLHARIAVPTLD